MQTQIASPTTQAPPAGDNGAQSHKNGNGSGRFLWTVDSFYRAIEGDVFDNPSRLELLNGELWEKEPLNPPHAVTIDKIARKFRGLFEPQYLVREEKPIQIGRRNEPIPDVLVAVLNAQNYSERHPLPSETRLLIEVTDITVNRDLVEKPILYAQAGVVEYWVVLLNERSIEIFRMPKPDGYADRESHAEDAVLTPLFAPDALIPASTLLPNPPTE